MNEERITKDAYILKVLEDDLDSGRYPLLKKIEQLIIHPNLLSDRENIIRSILLWSNGAFGRIFETQQFSLFYKEQIQKSEFLELFWCPKSSETEQDGIDLMSNNTRKISKLINFLQNNKSNSDPKINAQIKEFFNKELDGENKEIRLFIFENFRGKFIIDGNHRAGAIIKSLVENKQNNIFPITVYVARTEVLVND